VTSRPSPAPRKPKVASLSGAGLSPSGNGAAAWVGLILVAVLVCFSPALSGKKEFTNWDDPGYVTEQPLVRGLSWERLKAMFDPRTDVMLNFHPLTVLSLALNHQAAQLDIRPYALTNIVLHALNMNTYQITGPATAPYNATER
jgi:hypothetical protein